ncbi:uncharacterized protein LOC135956080 [Calliphora vicina]|uniref:uncharacterized protein LOC135956080 n=1 Tax=Calliphora vicina TaxID=7373 RepID=UPI00325AEAB8
MMNVKVAFALLAFAVVCAQAKPSHPYGFHGVPDHLDLVPPVLPPAHFHAAPADPWFPQHHAKFLPPAHFHAGHLLPAPAPLLPAPAPLLPAPAPLLPAPAQLLPAPAHFHPAPTQFLPAPAHFLPAPAPLLPAPVVHTHAHVVPAPAPILPPVYEALPFVEPLPSYRAIPGPKTTTHHVSVGYAFPQPRLAKLHAVSHGHVHAVPHAHLHAAPLTLAHHHHSLF